jgi:hypothetical protein
MSAFFGTDDSLVNNALPVSIRMSRSTASGAYGRLSIAVIEGSETEL